MNSSASFFRTLNFNLFSLFKEDIKFIIGFNKKNKKTISQIIKIILNLKNELLKIYMSLKAIKEPQNQNKILKRKIQQSKKAVINNLDFTKSNIFLNIIIP